MGAGAGNLGTGIKRMGLMGAMGRMGMNTEAPRATASRLGGLLAPGSRVWEEAD
ncbi:MAG: hypothetical protein JWR69_2176 [Pedosphaera sp.]|nr:hypothetical protein [Pedosphaera sp.]